MTYRAILIANWTYESGFDGLKGPQADLDVLKSALTDPEFGLFQPENVIVLADRPAREIKTELRTFLRDAERDDFLFIYFSGHGAPAANNLILCTSETPKDAPEIEGVEVRFINEMLPESRSETTMLVLDCCYAGRTKGAGAGTIDLEFAQNIYILASCGAFEVTPDAKQSGDPSPFTEKFAQLLVSPDIVADETGRVEVDAIWDDLQKLDPKPYRITSGRGSHVIAKRGDLREPGDRVLDPLVWLPVEAETHEIDIAVDEDGFHATWSGGEVSQPPLSGPTGEALTRMVELIDGVSQLRSDTEAPWNGVVDRAWQSLGNMLMEAALAPELREHLADLLERRRGEAIVRVRIRLQPDDVGCCPWEALGGSGIGAARLTDYLALTEGLVIERVLEPPHYQPQTAREKDGEYAIYSPSLSRQEASVMQQVALEMRKRSGELGVQAPGANDLIGGQCSWQNFLNYPATAPPMRLVLAMPLRSTGDGEVDVGFAGPGGEPDWRSARSVVKELTRSERRLDGIVIETFADAPARNAVRATIDFARMLAMAGIGPVAYICHPPRFKAYPLGGMGIPVTFAGQTLLALMKSDTLAPAIAVHHARALPLRLDDKLETTLGFPGLYSQPRPGRKGASTRSMDSGPAAPLAPSPKPTDRPVDPKAGE